MNFTKEEEKRLKEKFPFIIRKVDWYTGKKVSEDEWTLWVDDFPTGWWNAFGEQMMEELNQILVTYDAFDEFTFEQIKEKFGALRIYADYPIRMRDAWISLMDKYELKSQVICINCGAPAQWISKDWICPWCDPCIDEINEGREIEVEDKHKGYIFIEEYYDVTGKRIQDILDM